VGSALNCWEQFWPSALYGCMLRMHSLYPMLEWSFSGEQNKKANEHIKLRIRVHRKWRLLWPASDKSSALTHMDVGNAENVGNIFLPTNTQASLGGRNRFTLLSHGM
jgi:hypothetical protein